MMKKNKKLDLTDRSRDDIRLMEAKAVEKRLKGKLKRVEILCGHVLTTNPDKWKRHDVTNTGCMDTRLYVEGYDGAFRNGGGWF